MVQSTLRTLIVSFIALSGYAACLTPPTNSSRPIVFTISKTWDGHPVLRNESVKIVLNGDGESKGVTLKIESPFYNDSAPEGPPGEPFLNLWDYEVVEAFFLNDQQQYLEVEVGPHGQHIVLIFSGRRNLIRHSLPLNVTTKIKGLRWMGEAFIPSHYFPPQVTKFNAYAINGVGEKRRYLALYPTNGSTTEPDFHNLDFFQPIQMSQLLDLSNQHGCKMESLRNESETIALKNEETVSQIKTTASSHQSDFSLPSEGIDEPATVINPNHLIPSLFCTIENKEHSTVAVSKKTSELSTHKDSLSTSDSPHTTNQRADDKTSTGQASENKQTQNV